MKTCRITVIGPGSMGEAFIAGLIRNGADPQNVIASGPEQDRVDELSAKYGIQPFTDNVAAAKDADVIVLAVKPQRLKRVLNELRGKIKPDVLALSIVAGATMEMISTELDHQCIVRAMPNTPAQIGQGITVWTDSEAVTEAQCTVAREILLALGEEVYMEEEEYLDMATAVSGSGPAYNFMFMEAMIDAGVHLGFPRRIAEKLVIQTMRGSVEYYDQRKDHPAHLRNEVTSPAGTSAAALYYLEKAGFRTAISRAIWAAYERSQELGKGRSSQHPEKDNQ
jgi:pyrroline-5-carboxylate reductase